MVCYARPASWLAAIAIAAFLILGRPVGHFLDTAAVAVTVTAVIAGTAIAVALALAAVTSTRRRRTAAGGCVSCQFRCQHAMTPSSRQSWLVTTADRRAPVGAHPGTGREHGVAAATGGSGAPRWPDRPAHRSVASQGGGPQERTRSAA